MKKFKKVISDFSIGYPEINRSPQLYCCGNLLYFWEFSDHYGTAASQYLLVKKKMDTTEQCNNISKALPFQPDLMTRKFYKI